MRKLFAAGSSLLSNVGVVAPKQEYEIDGRVVVQEQLLSEGGFGYVYRARDRATGEVFALKKMLCQDKEG
eukprot:CAMPEP_0168706450 /NCGR_PEP_ID=MMETSP0503-20121227/40596_1 /TAXON_ID=89963 /ORGANISM="Heterocapsa rotundata, Strain SCCAP K-0483" /LENGTH=69 /DNA_ID=CAMNT_0008752687 /DNA_START=11 /DNA_END=216 /DNA_ORIENTATION=+